MSWDRGIETLSKEWAQRGWTLSLAESCTGGLLSSWITRLPGVSKIFRGSVVAYSNDAKSSLLGVAEKVIKKSGAVSEETALAMAAGAKKQFGSTWSVAVTGIAGPDGGSKEKPVGTVCFSVVGPGLEYSESQRFQGDRTSIQDRSARYALELLFKKAGIGFDPR